MRVKRQKKNRRTVRFFTVCFGFRQPFKVLCDAFSRGEGTAEDEQWETPRVVSTRNGLDVKDRPQFKRNRAKGPNPLSCMKKKKVTDTKKPQSKPKAESKSGGQEGKKAKLVPVGYEIKKLTIMLTIVDDLMSPDNLIEDYLTCDPNNEYIQSVYIVAFNKI
ncbi:unnamed protein product [Eruca vesicaria subsp. sativa]|uniref:Uncharacterized protein n=1 Tax=Eruca vesicaria subsp. sativa TaxID=29727 RepID=A0ABC8L085_ERUVS|nr:unnamed protein product [Eruca vesicaria subsp. sativa]